MLDLLNKMSIEEIVVSIVLLAIAGKKVVEFLDWLKNRTKTAVHKDEQIEEVKEQLQALTELMEQNLNTFSEAIEEDRKKQEKMQESIDLLMDSDKDDIKAWITEKHDYYVYERGYIDNYNLDCMEKRFKHYLDEHGNSFVEDLMNEVRALPKVSMAKNNNGHNKHQ